MCVAQVAWVTAVLFNVAAALWALVTLVGVWKLLSGAFLLPVAGDVAQCGLRHDSQWFVCVTSLVLAGGVGKVLLGVWFGLAGLDEYRSVAWFDAFTHGARAAEYAATAVFFCVTGACDVVWSCVRLARRGWWRRRERVPVRELAAV